MINQDNQDAQLMVDKICRSCMQENENMHNVFEKTAGPEDDTMLLSDMLMACASVEVISGDGLPYQLCDTCENKLSSAFEFKQQCEKSDTTLREITHQNERRSANRSAKQEDIVVQPDLLDLYDEDEMPLTKRKRGRPKKGEESANLTCTFCCKELQTRKGLRVHMRHHTGDGMRYCLICPSKYSRTNHLMRHMKVHDKPGTKHPCKFCSDKFSTVLELYKHWKSHHVDKSEKKRNKELKLKVKLEIKEEKKDDEDTEIKQKDPQPDSQQDVSGEANTMKLDDDLDSMDIPLTEYPFSDDGGDDRPNNITDEEDEDFLPRKKAKKQKVESLDKALYECKDCNKVMTTYIGLKIHMRRHTGNDLSKCKMCDKTFTKRSHLNRHMRTHGIFKPDKAYKLKSDNKKVMECEFCDRKFKYRKSFAHHMQTEHGMSDNESEFDPNNPSKAAEQIEKPENNNKDNEVEGEAQEEHTEDFNENNGESEGQPPIIDGALPKEEDEEEAYKKEYIENFGKKQRRMKVHTCHVCAAAFARANHLTRHMILHRSVLTHKCDRCDQAFATEDVLKKHVEEEHINKPYVCTVCNKPFSRGEHLIRHLKTHQSTNEQSQLQCSICEMKFNRPDSLARHTKTHLMQDKRHVCIECGKAFNRLDNLKTHQRIHTGIKDQSKLHLCVYCGKEFNNSSNMIVHMRRHTGERPYKCNECGKGFPRSHDLKCHERTHSGEKPYLCTLCGKSFNKSNKLLRHSRVHTGERPYVCNICSRAFTQSNDLALHMRRHTGARPYACGVCPARFIQSGQLKNHRRTTGHWMETQPDLKGGHRVEPVTALVEPTPIKFKTHGKPKIEREEIIEDVSNPSQGHSGQLASNLPQPQRILMGIMGNMKLQGEIQPLILESSKLVELHQAAGLGLVTLPSVIQGINGEEIKLKTEIGGFSIGHLEESNESKREVGSNSAFHDEDDSVTAYSTVQTTPTSYTNSENFNFQNFD